MKRLALTALWATIGPANRRPGRTMRRLTSILALLIGGWVAAAVSSVEIRAGQSDRPAPTASGPQAVLNQYCVTCHNQRLRTAGFALDTLDAAVYSQITGRHFHAQVLDGIDAAIAAGFEQIKLNTVLMRGRNEDQLLPLIEFGAAHRVYSSSSGGVVRNGRNFFLSSALS